MTNAVVTYYGFSRPVGQITNNKVVASNSATSTTSGGNEFEFRVYTTENTAATGGAHVMTKWECILALKTLLRYFLMGGSQLGTAGTAGQDNGVVLPIGAPKAGG